MALGKLLSQLPRKDELGGARWKRWRDIRPRRCTCAWGRIEHSSGESAEW